MPVLAPASIAGGSGQRRTAAPRAWPVRASDLLAVVLLNAVLIVGMWVRHGALSTLGSTADVLTGAGQLAALLGTYAALVQLALMARIPVLDAIAGLDQVARWHRVVGITCVWLIAGHVVLTTAGYAAADGSSVTGELWTLLTTYPWMLMAGAATALLLMVAVTSARASRARLRYETWHFLHTYAYLAVLLAFGHELAVGSDLSVDPVARGYWIALSATVLGCVLVFRLGRPLRLLLRHGLRVEAIVPEAPDVVSVYVTGHNLDRLAVRPGQFFRWRFITREGWWHAHPFSLSAPPNVSWLRLTVKGVGDHTAALGDIRPGTRVAIEGPFGVVTAGRRRHARALLVAGGIGITPLRALLEDLPHGRHSVVLLYRASTPEDLVFRAELDELFRVRGGMVRYLVGRRGVDLPHHPFTARTLRDLVPDVATRDVFICGPASMARDVETALADLHVPSAQIHRERFVLL